VKQMARPRNLSIVEFLQSHPDVKEFAFPFKQNRRHPTIFIQTNDRDAVLEELDRRYGIKAMDMEHPLIIDIPFARDETNQHVKELLEFLKAEQKARKSQAAAQQQKETSLRRLLSALNGASGHIEESLRITMIEHVGKKLKEDN